MLYWQNFDITKIGQETDSPPISDVKSLAWSPKLSQAERKLWEMALTAYGSGLSFSKPWATAYNGFGGLLNYIVLISYL